MIMPATQAEPNAKQLLAAVKQLSAAELSRFEQQFATWQKTAQRNGQLPSDADEERLIQATKISLPVAVARRLKKLQAKSEASTLAEAEWAEYRDLAKQAEQLTVLRVTALAE